MDSYFLAETVKYLYLLFDVSSHTLDFRDPAKYIFNTEAHLLPLPKVRKSARMCMCEICILCELYP